MVTITESEFVYLPGDSWWWRHDAVKLCIINICNDSKIRADAEVFGLFRDLIPPEVFQEGGELQYDSLSDVGEIRVYQRADFQSGSRVLKKVF